MDARSIIAQVRDGAVPSREALGWFANGLANGQVSDAQAGAFAMAVTTKGLGEAGRVALTEAMRDSGDVLSWDLPGPAIDKHSTGGVGDCVSLLLTPMLAAAGAFVPMISGRGLGHTGGTLDKLEAIPGVDTRVTEQRFRELVRCDGAAIVAATADLAPADKRLYAVRDVTATVESVDLITASILSKKLAAGLDALILDVKVGSGAFLPTIDAARDLAMALVSTANGAGCKTAALLTDMDQPLAPAAGNAIEIRVVLDVLTAARRHSRLTDLSVALAAKVAGLAGLDLNADMLRKTLSDGRAAEVFAKMMVGLGGPGDLLERYDDLLPKAPCVRPVPAPHAGYVAAINGRGLGNAAVRLGAGRLRESDRVDPSVGLDGLVPIGHAVAEGDPLAYVLAKSEPEALAGATDVAAAYTVSPSRPDAPALILGELP
ncbi:MAG: thymidine phosphorylase [Pseudomonadota bacterium]